MRNVSHVYVNSLEIARERTLQGMSQRALARKADLSLSTICNAERGRSLRVSLASAILISKALGKEFEELFYNVSNLDTEKMKGAAYHDSTS